MFGNIIFSILAENGIELTSDIVHKFWVGGIIERLGVVINVLFGENKTVPGIILVSTENGKGGVVTGILIAEVAKSEVKGRGVGGNVILDSGTAFIGEGSESGLGNVAVEASRGRHGLAEYWREADEDRFRFDDNGL